MICWAATTRPPAQCLAAPSAYHSGLVNSSFASGTPSLASETAVMEVARHVVGAHAAGRVNRWHVRRKNYVVASVVTQQPALRPIVKLEVPGERPNRHLYAMAAIARF